MKKNRFFLDGGNEIVALVNLDRVHNNGGRIFILSDLHGQAESLNNFLNEKGVTVNDLIIINGDAIDRGPDGIALLQWAKKNDNVLFLKGNHEELMLDALEEQTYRNYGPKMRCWIGNGGQSTLDSLNGLPYGERLELIQWVKDAPYVAMVQSCVWHDVIYVAHADLNQDFLLNFVIKNKIPYIEEDGVVVNALTWNRPMQLQHDLMGFLVTGHTSSHYYGARLGDVICDCQYKRAIIDCATARTKKIGYIGLLAGERIQFGSC